VNTVASPSTTTYKCQYCEKDFQRESTLAVHVCEPKRRWQEQNETGVQIGLQAYLRFYEITQGSAKLKNFDDFARSSYYRAFVKFGRHCVAIRAVNVPRFIDWVIKQNKKIDHWCRDSIYSEYLSGYLRIENINDAMARAIEQSIKWAEETTNPAHDYLRYGNQNAICYAISTGRISPWVLYNCESGQTFLGAINQEQLSMIWPIIDADFWNKKFNDYPADQEYAKDILNKAGW
jgi:hypothetical protein